MSISNIPQDTDDIVVPPFPFSEEEEIVADPNATDASIPKKKGKGVNQSEVFALQKIINGSPDPQAWRRFTHGWRYILRNYGEEKNSQLHVKVDGTLLKISDTLFNYPREHAFKIQCHSQSIQANIIPDDAEDSTKAAFESACSQLSPGCTDWEFICELINFFPEKFLSILEEAFPMVTSSVKNADVTKDILSIDLRFDLTVINHNVNQLYRIHVVLKRYHIEDVTDAQYLVILNRWKVFLFKEHSGAKYEGYAGTVYGHQIPNGKWSYHSLPSIQSSRLHDLINEEQVQNYNSLNKLLFELAKWLNSAEKKYADALLAGFIITFPKVIAPTSNPSTKRPPHDNVQGESSKFQKLNHQGSKPTGGGGKLKPTPQNPSVDHPDNKCSGCGNKPNWQESMHLPICTKTTCTFAAHPDYNSSSSWASSEVAKAYSKHVKNRKNQPVHSLTMNKKLKRDNNDKIIYPASTEDNIQVSKIISSNNIKNSSNDSSNNFSISTSS